MSLFATLEHIKPYRNPILSKKTRWTTNFILVSINTLLIKFALPATLISLSIWAQNQSIGFFNQWDTPLFLEIALSLLIFDLVIYGQHRLLHENNVLWNFHKVHHSDVDFDVTTGLRFHPIEILFSFFVKAGVIIALGAPALAVFIFEILLSSLALFNHSNFSLPSKFENLLRWFIVTPDMHRIHHSIIEQESRSNYGFNLSLWDRVFSSYKKTPINSAETMELGVKDLDGVKNSNWIRLLALPFSDKHLKDGDSS